ncbi:concanavalin A-like lectin/glucanase domain-containing protein [Fusarium redolens]|uniref:Concanavalin A-like lectin/glucanase domain-containing protein n=1 Tax=Fusarium redolens TaxID=48865 RepID=A0A9P9KDN9_FUSRE|nr:concanavalin A-like lectin/glucanase domain-containing protein [Fusarium redolens]KAH7253541.1 concanavalin A-like lectin/glucanase domain-containing protein [Fusarium redolens]
MTIRFLVNFGLLALPIAITLGVLIGLNSSREASGGPPLFKPDPKPTAPKKKNGITTEQHCQKSYGVHPETKGQEYTLNPNQWGWDEGDDGGLCLYVDINNNETYATKTTAPRWSVVWEYPQGPETAPVHAYPNIKVDGSVFPAKLNTIDKIEIDFEWTYAVGNGSAKGATPATKTDLTDLKNHLLNANVAMDMFMDSDQKKAQDSEDASHEIMVWFAAIGPATQPLGFNVDGANPLATKTLHGTEFKLYYDTNQAKQKVLTWYVDKPTEKFDGDLWPLIEEILSMDNANYPSSSDYIGYMSWGTEAYSANTTVTFDVPSLSINVEKKA